MRKTGIVLTLLYLGIFLTGCTSRVMPAGKAQNKAVPEKTENPADTPDKKIECIQTINPEDLAEIDVETNKQYEGLKNKESIETCLAGLKSIILNQKTNEDPANCTRRFNLIFPNTDTVY